MLKRKIILLTFHSIAFWLFIKLFATICYFLPMFGRYVYCYSRCEQLLLVVAVLWCFHWSWRNILFPVAQYCHVLHSAKSFSHFSSGLKLKRLLVINTPLIINKSCYKMIIIKVNSTVPKNCLLTFYEKLYKVYLKDKTAGRIFATLSSSEKFCDVVERFKKLLI